MILIYFQKEQYYVSLSFQNMRITLKHPVGFRSIGLSAFKSLVLEAPLLLPLSSVRQPLHQVCLLVHFV